MSRTYSQCVTKEQLEEFAKEGHTQTYAADVLGVSRWYVNRLSKRWNISHLFPKQGGAARWHSYRRYGV
jgi:transposase